jgi:hypothetical protein
MFETLKFRICTNETKILESSFKSTKSETESQQSTSGNQSGTPFWTLV